MKFRKFTAATVREALLQVKEELGPDAVIIRTEKVKKGLLGGSEEYCVTAALDDVLGEEESAPQPTMSNPTYGRPAVRPSLSTASASASPRPVPVPMQFEEQFEPSQIQTKMQDPKLPGFDEFRRQIRDDNDGLRRQMQVIQEELLGLKSAMTYQNESLNGLSQYPMEFRALAAELHDRGLSKTFLNDLIADLLVRLGTDERSVERQREMARQYLSQRIVAAGEINSRPSRASTIVFVGPTGVGKTTTIAKIAARLVLSGRSRVGILSTDSYRIGAIEQMQQFAEAADVEFRAVYDLEELDRALEQMSDKEFILIDTAGRSMGHEEHLDELRKLCRKILPDELHLVLAANTRDRDLKAACDQYKPLGVHRLLFTKIDETSEYAGIFNLSAAAGVPLSYFCFGQRIPDDLRRADAADLATWIMGDKL